MKKIISSLLLICPLIIFGQTHSIDKKNMSMSGSPSLPDISINIADIKGAEGRKNIAALKIFSKLKSTKIFFKL